MTDFTGAGHLALDYDLAKIVDGNQPPAVRQTAVRAVLEKFFLSALFILPTQGVEDTTAIYDEQITRLQSISETLTGLIEGEGDGLDDVRAEALTAKNFVDVFIETAQRIAEESAAITEKEIVVVINGGDLVDRDPDDGLEDPNDPDVRRSIALRAPFTFFPLSTRCYQDAYSQAIECGGCAITVKETRGLQARWVLRRITVVVEPWFSRRRIINRFVWVIEWVPVEFIKTIATRCCGDTPQTTVTKQTILDRELMTFWRCYP